MGKTKTRKYRGSGRHGRGRKGGRGKGLRGGKGNAGLHKHKYATTVKWQAEGYFHFGRVGIKPVEVQGVADTVINVGELLVKWPNTPSINLGEHGYTKLLGSGNIAKGVQVTVEAASAGAVKKIQAAGGKVTTSRVKKVKKPKAAPPKPGAAPAPAAKAQAPPAAKPAGKPSTPGAPASPANAPKGAGTPPPKGPKA